MDHLTFWRVLVGLLLCCPYDLLTSAAALKPIETKDCSSAKTLTITHIYSAPGDSEKIETVESDDNKLVFRHQLRLQSPSADCESNTLLYDLLARLQALELGMKEMKEQYEGCCGAAGLHCNGNGKFVPALGCQCDEGWGGPECSIKKCPGNCAGNGVCINGVCQCAGGFTGDDCSVKKCAHDCGKFGTCVDGVCQCAEGYTGPACRNKTCPSDCGEFKKCVDGTCVCADGHPGVGCNKKTCTVDCGPNGRCVDGQCVCDEGFMGVDCSIGLHCNGNGKFVPALGCQCDEGWEGPDCSIKKCPGNCAGNGVCINGVCQCAGGFKGDDCSVKKCAHDCGKFGTCVDGVCQCAEGYTGPACRNKTCPSDCGEFRKCVDGTCVCADGHPGVGCNKKTCTVDCGPNGRCVDGQCVCDEGFMGVDCSIEIAILCSYNGRYEPTTTICVCDEGWEGPDCSKKSCPNNCANNGVCVNGICQCAIGFPGADCSEKECLLDCGEHGKCVNGACQCNMGFIGLSCREKDCLIGCGKNGRCDGGQCFCEEGFFGESCSEVISVQNLRLISTKEDSLNIAWDLLVEVDYYYISYYPYGDQSLKRQIKVSAEQDYYQIGGLNPSTLYKMLMYQVKNGVTSDPAELEGRTEDSALGNLWVTEETEHSLEVEWENPDNRVDHFLLKYAVQPGGAETEITVSQSNDPKTRYTIKGLQPSTTYLVSVRSVRGGQKGKAASVMGITGIDGPKNLMVADMGEDTASLSWEAARAQIDRYILTYASPDGHREEMAVGKEKTTSFLTGLTPGMEYVFNIWAEKRNKKSKRATITAVTDIDAPKNLKASEMTQTEATLTWTPPVAQIDGYILTYDDADGNRQEIEVDAASKSFELKDLEKGAQYNVFLIAYKGERESRQVTTMFLTVAVLITPPLDCTQVQLAGNRDSGVYTIYPGGDNTTSVKVYCDQITDGGGWTIFQRRNSGTVDFYQRWRSYVDGFGDPSDEFWLGLEWIHKLTSTPVRYELRVDLRAGDESAYAIYRTFNVGTSRDRYKLTVDGYSGTAGDALNYHSGLKFSTWDRDSDLALTNCAITHHAAFWYRNCHLANPNGLYGDNNHSRGVNWEPWKGHEFSIPFVEMKMRPLDQSA